MASLVDHFDGPKTVPFSYSVLTNDVAFPSVINATFNGAGASGDFLACLDILTQDGKLLSRTFPDDAIPAGDTAEVTYAPFLRKRAAASTGTETEWASVGFAGPTDVPTGVTTTIGFGNGEFVTNASGTFSLREYDPGVPPNYYGLDVATASFYRVEFTIQMADVAGFRVVNPETFLITADNAGGHVFYEVNLLGSNYKYGVANGAIGKWEPYWARVLQFDGVTPTLFPPLAINVTQATGQTLQAYTNLHIASLPGGA